jgi:hypothetical protein
VAGVAQLAEYQVARRGRLLAGDPGNRDALLRQKLFD